LLLFHEMEAITHFIKRRICFIKWLKYNEFNK
jgi:hypothetical protein